MDQYLLTRGIIDLKSSFFSKHVSSMGLSQKNKGKPGPDGWNIERWNRNWEDNIERLREGVLSNTYKPNFPKRIKVRKKNGGNREICLFNISDKVMQRAVLNIIDDTFDRKFLNCSHGYRSNRSCATAVQQVLNYRDQGFHSVFEADIDNCFDTIDHSILMHRIEKWLHDECILHLMSQWLFYGRRYKHQATGIPQGAILSPLWCNIYLHPLDAKLCCERWRLIRYADDFIVLCEDENRAYKVRNISEDFLGKIKLQFSNEKTGITNFEEGFVFLGVYFYRDTFSYLYHDKNIKIEGRNAKMLFRNPPAFYEDW